MTGKPMVEDEIVKVNQMYLKLLCATINIIPYIHLEIATILIYWNY